MPPEDLVIPRFAAEPPQHGVPDGEFAERLQAEFLAACLRIDPDGEDIGTPGDVSWFPDRTWAGRTYVPVTAPTTTGYELFGYVSFAPGDPDAEDPDERDPFDFVASADFTDEIAERHPDWKMDISEEVVGGWRGEGGRVAAMTLVWGVPLVRGGALATAELAGVAVDQCRVSEDRFTLLGPDAYRSDYLEVALWSIRGEELARESLYEDDEEDEDDEE
jgi:hypothetical protein